jgi:hypothetical protein
VSGVQRCLRPLPWQRTWALTARHNLARFLGEAGRPAEAVTELRALLGDLERMLGADHPHTLATRQSLAFWLIEFGGSPETNDN